MEEKQGYVTHIIYRNEENGYTVFEILSDEETIGCTGYPGPIHEGEGCVVSGKIETHPIYGEQLKIDEYRALAPQNADAVFRYLSSGAVKGIGETLAERIVKRFGEDAMRILTEEPERLSEVKGISERMARSVASQFQENKDERDALLFMQQYGITNKQAIRIYQTYGLELYGILKENPYRLAEDIDGIGFLQADAIARRIGIQIDSGFRVRSALLYALDLSVEEGHCFLPEETLLEKTANLLAVKPENPLLQTELMNLITERVLILKHQAGVDAVYSATTFYREKQIAETLLHLSSFAPRQEIADYKEPLAEAELEHDELQEKALRYAADHTVLLISGGPGTGKTTIIRSILSMYRKANMEVLLAAPTGRAAKRMAVLAGQEAMTLHRLLGIRPAEEDGAKSGFFYDRNEEAPLEADAIIVDEMSMVDIFLFHSLIRAVRPGCRLILVGDVEQLPSVGPGRVLKDLIASKAFPTVMLQKIFRQEEESDIVRNAHRILRGEELKLNNDSKDFFFLERESPEVIYKHIVQLIREMLPGYLHCDREEIQVLTPMRGGSLGVETLNKVLQSVLNPPAKNKPELNIKNSVFREGDKVMQTRNNYAAVWEIPGNFGIPIESGEGVFNGDFGRIIEIDKAAETLQVLFDDERVVRYERTDMEDLELAYAVTVHKSQGSEYPAIILPLLSGPSSLMNRNLLYTAVTRARSAVVILGSRQCLTEMEKNRNENKRHTGLQERIRELR